MNTENNLLREQIESIEGAVEFFSSSNKTVRETWVVNEFISNLGIKFKESEIRSNDNDPPDVIFRDALFEIKEIQNKDRKRHKEYKEKLKKAQQASNIEDLMRSYTPKVISMKEMVDRINEEAEKILYEPEFCKRTDLLFYVNLTSTYLSREKTFDVSGRDNLTKWRSVSIVESKASCVLRATDSAPEFLKAIVGKMLVRDNINT
jgi:uncharacterized UPF0160 family protein